MTRWLFLVARSRHARRRRSERPHLVPSPPRRNRVARALVGEQRRERLVRAPPAGLQHCEPCRERYAQLLTSIHDLRDEALAEADAAFTPERLAAQRAHILRRLENADRPARVLPFPVSYRSAPPRRPAARRWIAAAAAAGLLAGAAAGHFLDPWSSARRFVGTDANRGVGIMTQSRANPALSGLSAANDEDLLLDEVDQALEAPVILELEAIDALTPHVQTVSMEIK